MTRSAGNSCHGGMYVSAAFVLGLATAATVTVVAQTPDPVAPKQPTSSVTVGPPSTSSKGPPMQASPMPLDWQVEQLRNELRALSEQVKALQGVNAGYAISDLHNRMGALEGVLTVTPSKVTLRSAGALELRASGTVELRAGGVLTMQAPVTQLASTTLNADGVITANSIVVQSVTAASYTPGAGNVW